MRTGRSALAPAPARGQRLLHGDAEVRGRPHRAHARCLERGVLVGRRTLPARDHGAGVAHALARGRGDARDVGDDGLRHLAVNVFRGRLFVRAADLADHDDAGRVLVALEEREHFDEIESPHRVASDADAGRLAEADVRRLEDGFVRQRPGTRDDPDLAGPMDEARHDADLAFARRDDAGAVRADEPALASRERRLHAHHVVDRDAFGDADDEANAGVRGLEDRVGGVRGRHVDHADVGFRRLDGVVHGVEHRPVEVPGPAAARRDAADEVRAVGDRLLGMESALLAGEALAVQAVPAIDEDAHRFARPRASRTALVAASETSLATVIASPLAASSARALSAFVPSRRTTTGRFTPATLTAWMMPSAMTSQRTMPPKMFTRIARARAFERIRRKAAVTRSAVAVPPTSRKLAGSPPCSLMRSIVAIARPAPFTMQAMLPSSET